MAEAAGAGWVLDLHATPSTVPAGPTHLHAPSGSVWPEAGLPAMPAGDDPAYIVFTSGTTGRPRGILGTHKGWRSSWTGSASASASARRTMWRNSPPRPSTCCCGTCSCH
ncbi:AMP-binding protein [Pseudoroseomonas wenyumeiae]